MDTTPRSLPSMPERGRPFVTERGSKYQFEIAKGSEIESLVQIAPDGGRKVITKRKNVSGLVADGQSIYWLESADTIDPYEDMTWSVKRYSPGKPSKELAVRKNIRFSSVLTLERMCWLEPDTSAQFDSRHLLTCVPKTGGSTSQSKEKLDKNSDIASFGRHVFVLPDSSKDEIVRFRVPDVASDPPRKDGMVQVPTTSHFNNLEVDGSGVYWIDSTKDAINWVAHEAFDTNNQLKPVELTHVPDTRGGLKPQMFSGAGWLTVDSGTLHWLEDGAAKELSREVIAVLVARGGTPRRDETLTPIRAQVIDDICEVDIKYGYEFPGSAPGSVLRQYPSCFSLAAGKFCCDQIKTAMR